MNPLQRTLIEKTGHDHGFEHVLAQDANSVTLASARHRARAVMSVLPEGSFEALFQPATPMLLPELRRSFANAVTGDEATFHAVTLADLAQLLRRAANLSQALPSQAAQDYQVALANELAQLPPSVSGTEVERIVSQRVGQERFRAAMLDYWGGSCAVTGVAIPEVLRASHAKPWAQCISDAERLDVFNGFLLVANLDALFDRFLISFDDDGRMLFSPRLAPQDWQGLGIQPGMALRWLADTHRPYLAWHQKRFATG